MRTKNGYLTIEQQGDETVLIATELTAENESGSRSATVLLTLGGLEDAITKMKAIRDEIFGNAPRFTNEHRPSPPGSIHTNPVETCPICAPERMGLKTLVSAY